MKKKIEPLFKPRFILNKPNNLRIEKHVTHTYNLCHFAEVLYFVRFSQLRQQNKIEAYILDILF